MLIAYDLARVVIGGEYGTDQLRELERSRVVTP
jgi:hypothetical protein